MSRIGLQPVTIPVGVSVTLQGNKVSAQGPKGSLELSLPAGLTAVEDDNTLKLQRSSESKNARSMHGLYRSLLSNLLEGVSQGYSKQLEINGVGFRASASGQKLTLNLGFSHDVEYLVPEGVSATVDGNVITISGTDKQQVGQVAAEIRALRKPEPYKGKGIIYVGEHIIRKAGKAAAGGKE